MKASPEHFARALVDFLEVEQPFKFADIVRDLGLQVRQVNSTGFDGALVRVAGVPLGIIAVREDILEKASKRFTVAHEIGHYVLPGHEADCSVCTESDIDLLHMKTGQREKEANKFAAELLLPRIKILEIVTERGLSFDTCKFISRKFETSLTVAAIRCIEVTGQKAAFVESRKAVVRSFERSRTWKDFIAQGREIGSQALARQLSINGYREKKGRVPEIAWIWDETGKGMLTEESMLMPQYNTVLSILIQDEP